MKHNSHCHIFATFQVLEELLNMATSVLSCGPHRLSSQLSTFSLIAVVNLLIVCWEDFYQASIKQ